MKSIIFVAVFLFSLPLFGQNNLKIKGKLLNSNIDTVYLDDFLNEVQITSSAVSKAGEFDLSGKIEKTGFYKLIITSEIYLLLILEPNENVVINLDINDYLNPTITGSKQSALVYNTFQQTKEYDKKVEEYKEKIINERKNYIRQTINSNPSSLACLFFVDELDINEDLEIYKKLVEGLKPYSDLEWVKELAGKVNEAGQLSVGSLAPEIDLPAPDGKKIKLSSLKGKIVLIDFWAAWCKPCRMESPNLVKAYETFRSKGFEIYSVSLDQSKDDWTNAIAKDGLGKWIHVSDLKYWDSAAADVYGVKSIPFTVLIDKQGKIIAKGLRGDALNKKLEELFK